MMSCDLYLWRGSDTSPSIVYLINTSLSYKESEKIAIKWERTGGKYALMGKGHIPWFDENKQPTIKRISKDMVDRI